MSSNFSMWAWIMEVDEDDGDYEHDLEGAYHAKACAYTDEEIETESVPHLRFQNHRDLNGLIRMIDDAMNELIKEYGEPPIEHRNVIREKILGESFNNCAKCADDGDSYETEARKLKARLERVLRGYPQDPSSRSQDYEPSSHLHYW